MTRLLELRQLEYDMIELETELSDEQYRSLVEECLLYGLLSSKQQYSNLKGLHNILMRITSIHEERIGLITVEVVDTGWCPTAEFWNAACQASKSTYKEE